MDKDVAGTGEQEIVFDSVFYNDPQKVLAGKMSPEQKDIKVVY